MKQRKGRKLIVETFDDKDRTGPIAGGVFPNAFWAWLFKHFENRVPPKVAIEQTTWRGFRNWHDALAWLERE